MVPTRPASGAALRGVSRTGGQESAVPGLHVPAARSPRHRVAATRPSAPWAARPLFLPARSPPQRRASRAAPGALARAALAGSGHAAVRSPRRRVKAPPPAPELSEVAPRPPRRPAKPFSGRSPFSREAPEGAVPRPGGGLRPAGHPPRRGRAVGRAAGAAPRSGRSGARCRSATWRRPPEGHGPAACWGAAEAARDGDGDGDGERCSLGGSSPGEQKPRWGRAGSGRPRPAAGASCQSRAGTGSTPLASRRASLRSAARVWRPGSPGEGRAEGWERPPFPRSRPGCSTREPWSLTTLVAALGDGERCAPPCAAASRLTSGCSGTALPSSSSHRCSRCPASR